MLFNSLSFLFFFPVVVISYFALPHRFRTIWLLAASCFFYMAFVPKYVLILFFLITIDYFLARLMERTEGSGRRLLLVVSVVANLGTLFFFKYFNFFNQNIASLADFLGWNYPISALSVILPIGLSFHVFQSLSYVIEVYRKNYRAEKRYLTYALYVMFFPQLVAGPIERPAHLLPQLKLNAEFNAVEARRGLERMLWGFFKKLVIADNIAVIVNYLYGHLPANGPSLMLLLVLFSYQLYCDFSGYSDIAIGSAKILGVKLSENFDRPYASRSVAEFWRRWHISLSSWLRDYLYVPLALSWGKASRNKLYVCLFVTFVAIGIWHGAAWTFVALGATHGMYLIAGQASAEWRRKMAEAVGLTDLPRLRRALQVACVFALVSLGWVFFRAKDLSQVWFIFSNLGDGFLNIFSPYYIAHNLFRGLHLGKLAPLVIFGSVMVLEIVQYYQARLKTFYIFENRPTVVRYSWYYGLTLIIMIFGYLGSQTFIYFQF